VSQTTLTVNQDAKHAGGPTQGRPPATASIVDCPDAHGPLIATVPGVERYLQNHCIESAQGHLEPPFLGRLQQRSWTVEQLWPAADRRSRDRKARMTTAPG